MTELERRLTESLEKMQIEHSEQMQQLSLQVKILRQQVSELATVYSDLTTILDWG